MNHARHLVQLCLVECEVLILVELDENRAGEQVVEAPDMVQGGNISIAIRVHVKPGFGEDVGVGEGRRRKRQSKKGGPPL